MSNVVPGLGRVKGSTCWAGAARFRPFIFAAESSIASRARVEIRRWPPARGIRKMGARGEE